MLLTNAIFSRKESRFEHEPCVIEKVIRLSGAEYDRFRRNMLEDQDFIADNKALMFHADGARHCLLVVGEERRDGVLVDSSGYDYARYSAFVPNAEDFLTVGQSPALAALNKKLTDIVEIFAEQAGVGNPDGRGVVNLQEWDSLFRLDLTANDILLNTVLDMLGERPEIKDFFLDKNNLIIYREPEGEKVEGLSDPTVTRLDMYAYGYAYDDMIPLRMERALELFDAGHEIFRLYLNGAERPANTRTEIEVFDGMFGVVDPAWDKQARGESVEAFIMNRERYERDDAVGEWLTLPADADTLHSVFKRIGVDRPSEGAFNVAAVRVPHEYLQGYVCKYDSLDELNMLASYIDGLEDFELDKLQAILTTGIMDIGSGIDGLINLLDSDNFDAFNIIGAADYEALGRYLDEEKPDGVSFAEYGRRVAEHEKGVFTEWGYLYCRYGELFTEYNGVVPDEYKIIGEALRGLRPKTQECGGIDEKPSVVEQIRAARQAPREPKDRDAQKHKKAKGGPQL